jgi:KipI family sensor histidine kinase inhibitor
VARAPAIGQRHDKVAGVWRIDPAGDQALLVRLGTAIDPVLLGEVLALERTLSDAAPAGLLGTVPSYASLLCRYDPIEIDFASLEQLIRRHEGQLQPIVFSSAITEIPTLYDGPDLDEVSASTNFSRSEVIALHAGRDYLVYCVGFAPGFTYCGEVDQRLAVPRKASPRSRVEAGSVAIANRQTGIYGVDSPGGWHVIGHTDLPLFDPTWNSPVRFKPGDRIRFVPTRD